MKFPFKKSISMLLSLCLIFSMLSSSVFAKPEKTNEYNLQTVVNDESKTVVKAEYDGDEVYATLDKATYEVTMQTIEHPKKTLGLSLSKEKDTVKNYKVKIQDNYESATESKQSFTLTDVESKKDIKINKHRAKAQLPLLIPLAEIVGAALIDYLTAAAAVAVVAGVTYVVASSIATTLKNKNQDYYMAYIDYGRNNVMIGAAITSSTAYARANSGQDVWCRNQVIAFNLANNFGSPIGPELHGNGDVGYYPHYHPRYPLGGRAHLYFSS